MSAHTIEQKMDDSSVCGGVAPATESSQNNDMEVFAEGSVGGLFDFGNKDPLRILQFFLAPGSGTSSWTLKLVDADDVETTIASAGNNTPVLITVNDGGVGGMILLEGQKLKLESSGGPTSASQARISATRQLLG